MKPLRNLQEAKGNGSGLICHPRGRGGRARRVKSGFLCGIAFVNILALESSTELCSVALWRDGSIAAREAADGQRNSEALLPLVDALLAAQGVARADLEGGGERLRSGRRRCP